MTILTALKMSRDKRKADIRAEYNTLIQEKGAMATAVYKYLAYRYNVSERTIFNYVNKNMK